MKDDMDELGLHSEWVVFRNIWGEASYQEERLTISGRGHFKNKW